MAGSDINQCQWEKFLNEGSNQRGNQTKMRYLLLSKNRMFQTLMDHFEDIKAEAQIVQLGHISYHIINQISAGIYEIYITRLDIIQLVKEKASD